MRLLACACLVFFALPGRSAAAQFGSGVWSRTRNTEVQAEFGLDSTAVSPITVTPSIGLHLPLREHFEMDFLFRAMVGAVRTNRGENTHLRMGNLGVGLWWPFHRSQSGTQDQRGRFGIYFGLPVGSLFFESEGSGAIEQLLFGAMGQYGSYNAWLTAYQSSSTGLRIDGDYRENAWTLGYDALLGLIISAYNSNVANNGSIFFNAQVAGYGGYVLRLASDQELTLGARLQLVLMMRTVNDGRGEGQFSAVPFVRWALLTSSEHPVERMHAELRFNINVDPPFGPSFSGSNPYGLILSGGLAL